MEPKRASAEIAAFAGDVCSGRPVRNEFPRATDAEDRVLGTELAGALSRGRIYGDAPEASDDILAELTFNGGSVAGQGLGAFNAYGLAIRVEGGAQDGVGKGMLGGSVSILKGKGARGQRVNGSVGKSFAYGAQRGRLFVQGSADSRFCIRLSGADIVLGGEPEADVDDSQGCIVDRANAKGFAFEYMTSGRAVVLGDIGPWACAGMTGGRVYTRVGAFGIDRELIESRLGEGAKVNLEDLDAEGVLDVQDLLGHYAMELRASGQEEEAESVLGLAGTAAENFLMVVPERVQADPSISTE
jgi:glutamate synthase (NADPH/NADH) large chain